MNVTVSESLEIVSRLFLVYFALLATDGSGLVSVILDDGVLYVF